EGASEATHPATHKAILDGLKELSKPAEPATAVSKPAAAEPELQSSGKLSDFGKSGVFDTVPRTQNGETVIQQALLGLDKPTLLKIAKARGISTTQEANLVESKANPSLVKKIGDSLTQDEIDDARDIGIEMSRHRPVQNANISEEAGKEA